MGSVVVRPESGNLYFDFRYHGIRCREQTALPDTPANRKKMKQVLERIEAEITLGSFEYRKYFPGSSQAAAFDVAKPVASVTATPLFKDFAATWMSEMRVEWRASHYDTNKNTLDKHLLPAFGEQEIGKITKADLLSFRAKLADVKGRKGRASLSPSRINHIMTPLRMILEEAADRFEFKSPYRKIDPLKVPRSDVLPFTIEQVRLILEKVRPDFKNYYAVRFFTGMRTGEIDGLKWEYVDFERGEILIREARVRNETVQTKTDGSFRTIDMSAPVREALLAQKALTAGRSDYVFCTGNGQPLEHANVTKRVWYPLLRHLDIRLRRPYQTRHTAATLWLAAGENPEWIARQLGHTTTEMLFRVYSRFVPNLTRRDGAAMERLLRGHLSTTPVDEQSNLEVNHVA